MMKGKNKMDKMPMKKAMKSPMGKKTMIGGKNMTQKKGKVSEDTPV